MVGGREIPSEQDAADRERAAEIRLEQHADRERPSFGVDEARCGADAAFQAKQRLPVPAHAAWGEEVPPSGRHRRRGRRLERPCPHGARFRRPSFTSPTTALMLSVADAAFADEVYDAPDHGDRRRACS